MVLLEIMSEHNGIYELKPEHKFSVKELMLEFYDIEKPKVVLWF